MDGAGVVLDDGVDEIRVGIHEEFQGATRTVERERATIAEPLHALQAEDSTGDTGTGGAPAAAVQPDGNNFIK